MKHTRQNQLHGAALGTHHHIDIRQVAFKGPVHLFGCQQHKRDGRQPQRQQQQIERGSQRARPQVAKRDCYYIHSYNRLSGAGLMPIWH